MSSVVISGDTSGTVTLQAPATAGTTTLTLPATSGIIVATPTGVAGGQLQTEIFTSPGTWTKPAAATQVTVRVVGGSGGASGSPGPGATITRGGAGGYALVAGVPVAGPVAITVGAGGTGGSNPNGSGTSGGTSSFGPDVSCTGGNGGVFPGGTQTPGTATVSSGTAVSLTSGLSDAYVSGGGSFNSGGSPAAVTYSVPAKYNAGAPQAVAPGGANTGGIGGVVVVEYVG